MKTMKTIIAVALLASGLSFAACDDAEPIAPNDMTSGGASKQTVVTDSTTTGGTSGNPTVTNGNGTGTGGTGTGGNGNGNGGTGIGNMGP